MYQLGQRAFVRRFATAVKPAEKSVATQANFNVVKFISEDPAEVIKEVPEYSFYDLPDDIDLNPFKSAGLAEKVVNVPEVELPNPEYKFSKLENGMKIVSCDKGGLGTSMGLYVNAGARHENPACAGVSHMLEMVAFKSTAHLSHLRTCKTFESLGVDAYAKAGRESVSYHASCLREHFPLIAPLLIGNVLYPRLLRWEVNASQIKVGQYEKGLLADTDDLVGHLSVQAAFHNNSLGNPLYATRATLPHFTEHTMRDFLLAHFAPERMTFVGVNCDHDELCKWLMRSFADYNAIPLKNRDAVAPKYTGGWRTIAADDPSTHISLGFLHPGGWNASDSMALSVYQTLLGGSMEHHAAESKLAKHTLSNPAVGSAMAFNNQFSDAGLFGVYGSVIPSESEAYIKSVHAAMVAPFTPEDLNRAKNTLKRVASEGVSTAEELVEDIGKQMIMSGNALSPEQIASKIDAVTEAQIKQCQSYVSACKPTVVVYGNTNYVPHYDEICEVFKGPVGITSAAQPKPTQGAQPKKK